jgi:hypothetical protein
MRIARAIAAVVAAVGTFCLTYHLLFYGLWRFLFGKEVWPWPLWGRWVLVVIPALFAIASAVFFAAARLDRRNSWIAGVISALAVYGLLRYGGEVWKVLFELGFRP